MNDNEKRKKLFTGVPEPNQGHGHRNENYKRFLLRFQRNFLCYIK